MTGTCSCRFGYVDAPRRGLGAMRSPLIDPLLGATRRSTSLLSWLVAVLALAGVAQAQVTLIDDFESYGSSANLQAAWVALPPLPAANVTLQPAGISGKSMSVQYDLSAGTNAVEFTFGSDQDFTLRTTIRINYKVTGGSNNEDLVVELRDAANNVLVSGVAPGGTGVGQAAWETNLVPVSETLSAVRKIRLAVRDRGDMMGTGTILFDNVSLSSGTYSTCRSCHGEFMGKPYVAFTDGQTWSPDLHTIHQQILSFDCATCHTLPNYFPVFIGSSTGGTGLPGVGCLGCHGREEDKGHDSISSGRAAGLNQHHHRSGVTECAKCHTDADPAGFTPVGENVLPAYYAITPDAAHPDKPTDPCSDSEHFVSPFEGLDNDGDLRYEQRDPDCQRAAPAPALGHGALVACIGLLLGVGLWRLRVQKRRQV